MKKIYLSATMALFLAATSCQNEEVVESVQNGREFRVEVSVGGGSRTDIGEDGTMTWSEGDQIYVGNGNNTASGVLTLVSGAGSANAVFAGIVTGSGNLEYSVFPVPNANGEIDLTTRKAGQSNAPLISTFNPSNPGELSFEKTCGVVRIEVSGEKGGELTLNTEETANQQHLGGVAKVVKNGDKFELQYTRGNGGVTITDLPENGYVDVPVITEAVKNGAEDNLPAEEITFEIVVGDDEPKEFSTEVETGKVQASGVPVISAWDGTTTDTEWYDSQETEIEIATAEELAGFALLVNEGNSFEGKTVKLMANIGLNSKNWTPIGTSEKRFGGTFDGNGYKISYLTISEIDYAAFIAYTSKNVTIKNLTLDNISINSPKYAAGVVCISESGLTLENIKVSGAIKATSYAGGLIHMPSDIRIINSENSATVESQRAAGIGSWVTNAKLENVQNYGNIKGTVGASGIAHAIGGSIKNAANYGKVISNGTEPAAGIAGVQKAESSYEYCFNYGDVTSTADNPNSSAAGILGQTPGTAATLNYCANYGNITAEKSYAAGISYSLYGNVNASYCYNEGKVFGDDAAGGIAPKAQFGKGDKANNCLNAGTISSNGKTYQGSNNNTSCYYYSDETLLNVADNKSVEVQEALKNLNGGKDSEFFTLKDGKISVVEK